METKAINTLTVLVVGLNVIGWIAEVARAVPLGTAINAPAGRGGQNTEGAGRYQLQKENVELRDRLAKLETVTGRGRF
ncbi:MAG: hypothetical protein ACYS8Z_19950 [Planctomycetota bacterium]|jgi:hypothetical protein